MSLLSPSQLLSDVIYLVRTKILEVSFWVQVSRFIITLCVRVPTALAWDTLLYLAGMLVISSPSGSSVCPDLAWQPAYVGGEGEARNAIIRITGGRVTVHKILYPKNVHNI